MMEPSSAVVILLDWRSKGCWFELHFQQNPYVVSVVAAYFMFNTGKPVLT